MPHSYAETLTLTCANCGRDFDPQFWLIVDVVERPDLLAHIRADDLHDAQCPHCAAPGHMDAPLLLFNPSAGASQASAGADPLAAGAGFPTVPLLFSPAEQTTADETLEQARQLLEMLQTSLGDQWQDDWLASGLPVVPREHLSAALNGNTQVDPQLQGPMAVLADAGDLGQHLLALLNAGNMDNGRQVIEHHPELLTEEADALIQRLLAVEERPQARQLVDAWRGLLARCRVVGINQAFEEYRTSDGNMDVPPQFRADLQQAKEAEQHYLRTGDRSALNAAAAAWERILGHSTFPSSDERFQLAVMNDAGGVFLRRYWATGGLADLNRALELGQTAVQRTPPDSPDLPGYLNNLANGLSDRYARTGALQDLHDAVGHWQRAVTLTAEGSPDLPMYLNNLAAGLRARYARTGALQDLHDAVGHWQRAVTLTAEGSPDLPSILNNLAAGLRARYARTGALQDLHDAVGHWQRAVTLTAEDSPDLPSILNNLAAGLRDRYARTGALQDLQDAVGHWQRAVTLTAEGSPDLPMYLNNLANGLRDRYARTGALQDLQDAVGHGQRAVTLTAEGSPDLPGYLNNLANGLRDRYARTGALQDLHDAVGHWQRAVTLTAEGSPDLPSILNNLANGLRDRYARTGALQDLQDAVGHWQRAVTLTAEGSPDLPSILNNLANGLSDRYARTGALQDLQDAVRHWQRAVTLTEEGSPDLPGYLNNLATGLRDRYARTGALQDLQDAVGHGQRAVTLTAEGSPDLPSRLNNLANGLRARYARTGALQDLHDAVGHGQRAVTLTAEGSPDLPSRLNNLANGLRDRYARTGALQDLQDAQKTYARACRGGQIAHPETTMLSSRSWGNWALERRQWQEATEAYAFGRQAMDLLFAVQTNRAAKESWLKEAQGLPANAAYALTRLDRLQEAVETLEAGRARLLAEALEANRRDLAQLALLGRRDLLERYRAASEQLATLQAAGRQPASSPDGPALRPDFAALRRQMEAARGDLDAAIAAIRQVDGYQDFFLPPSFAQIQQAATPDAPLVYLLATSAGGLALTATAPSQKPNFAEKLDFSAHVAALWLDDLTEAALHEILAGSADAAALGGYLGAYARWRRNPDDAASDAWRAALDATTRWLWDAAMQPVVEHLAAQGATQAVLLPAGLLGLLPLHAAWTEDASAPTGRRYALDALTISYAPSAGALRHSLAGAAAPADGLLAVDNPDGSLVFSRQEVAAVRSYFPPERSTVLAGAGATRQAVLRRLAALPASHFSTHGWAGWDDPLQGGLLLANGAALTLADILDLRLEGARLAVLSACETGVPGTKLPDEVVSLPTGLVQAGVAGVVASLWAVNDRSTAMLMERFYRLWREDGLAPAEALRRAQIWLRDSSNSEMVAYFEQDVPALAGYRMPEGVAAELYVERMLQLDGNARSFAHPFYWAAFTMTGA